MIPSCTYMRQVIQLNLERMRFNARCNWSFALVRTHCIRLHLYVPTWHLNMFYAGLPFLSISVDNRNKRPICRRILLGRPSRCSRSFWVCVSRYKTKISSPSFVGTRQLPPIRNMLVRWHLQRAACWFPIVPVCCFWALYHMVWISMIVFLASGPQVLMLQWCFQADQSTLIHVSSTLVA